MGVAVVEGEAGGKTGRLLAFGGTSGEKFTGLMLLEDGCVYYVKPSVKVDLSSQFEGLLLTPEGEIVGARSNTENFAIPGKEERFAAVIQSGGYQLLPQADRALTVTRGGIDLNSKNLLLDVNGDKINIKFDGALIEQFKQGDFSGVRPVILNIVPVANMYLLLGMAPGIKEEQLAKV
jgi:hypothetical protein